MPVAANTQGPPVTDQVSQPSTRLGNCATFELCHLFFRPVTQTELFYPWQCSCPAMAIHSSKATPTRQEPRLPSVSSLPPFLLLILRHQHQRHLLPPQTRASSLTQCFYALIKTQRLVKHSLSAHVKGSTTRYIFQNPQELPLPYQPGIEPMYKSPLSHPTLCQQ